MIESPLRVFIYHGRRPYIHGLRQQMEALGHQVVGEADGDPTEAALAVPDAGPEVVVVLLGGGAEEGIDFATTLRLEVASSSLPVIFIGGGREEADRAQKVLPRAILAEEPTLQRALAYCQRPAGQDVEENPWLAMHERDLRRDRESRPLPPWLAARP